MTKEFAREYLRTEFGPQIPVSAELLAMSNEPISAFYERDKPDFDITNPVAISERGFAETCHLPSKERVLDYLNSLDENTRRQFESSKTWAECKKSWALFASDDAPPYNYTYEKMPVEWVVALGLYFDGLASNRKYVHGGLKIPNVNSKSWVEQYWVKEFTPVMLDEALVYIRSNLAQAPKHFQDALTVAEMLHPVSRYPSVFPLASSITNSCTMLGREALRPLAGDAWLSFLALANSKFHRDGRFNNHEAVIAFAAGLVGAGVPVEELQPYVTALPADAELIAGMVQNGVGADMLHTFTRESRPLESR